jgi:hypothetical protein
MDLPHPFGLRFREAMALLSFLMALLACLTYWISRLIQARTMAGVPNCPKCGLMHTSLPAGKGAADWLFEMFGCFPQKCSVCRFRFYRPSPAVMETR